MCFLKPWGKSRFVVRAVAVRASGKIFWGMRKYDGSTLLLSTGDRRQRDSSRPIQKDMDVF